MYCSKCGTEIYDDATFCPKCGERVENSGKDQQNFNSTQYEAGGAAPSAFFGNDMPQSRTASGINKRNSRKPFIIITACVVACALLAVGVWFASQRMGRLDPVGPDEGKSNNATTSVNEARRETTEPDTTYTEPSEPVEFEVLSWERTEAVRTRNSSSWGVVGPMRKLTSGITYPVYAITGTATNNTNESLMMNVTFGCDVIYLDNYGDEISEKFIFNSSDYAPQIYVKREYTTEDTHMPEDFSIYTNDGGYICLAPGESRDVTLLICLSKYSKSIAGDSRSKYYNSLGDFEVTPTFTTKSGDEISLDDENLRMENFYVETISYENECLFASITGENLELHLENSDEGYAVAGTLKNTTSEKVECAYVIFGFRLDGLYTFGAYYARVDYLKPGESEELYVEVSQEYYLAAEENSHKYIQSYTEKRGGPWVFSGFENVELVPLYIGYIPDEG